MKKVIERMRLLNMPLDKDGSYATGYALKLEDGNWVDEYEDSTDLYEDSDDCIYTDEEES